MQLLASDYLLEYVEVVNYRKSATLSYDLATVKIVQLGDAPALGVLLTWFQTLRWGASEKEGGMTMPPYLP